MLESTIYIRSSPFRVGARDSDEEGKRAFCHDDIANMQI